MRVDRYAQVVEIALLTAAGLEPEGNYRRAKVLRDSDHWHVDGTAPEGVRVSNLQPIDFHEYVGPPVVVTRFAVLLDGRQVLEGPLSRPLSIVDGITAVFPPGQVEFTETPGP